VASEQPVQVGTDLVSFTFAESVALSTSCLEEVGTLLCVACIVKLVSKKFLASFAGGKQDLGASWRQRGKMEKRISGFVKAFSVDKRLNGPDISTFHVGSMVS
jgi:hypothetical protein